MSGKEFQVLAIFALVLVGTGASAADCKIERQASLPVTFNGFVPTVPAHINGHLVSIGVDTGSSTTLLTPEAAARLRLPRAKEVFLNSFEFGRATELMKTVPVVAIAGPDGAPEPGTTAAARSPDSSMAGLVGTEILSDYDLEFRFPAHILNLYRVSNCDKVTPPWEGVYAAVPVSLSETKRFVVPVDVDGQRLTAIFDTGASGLRISRSAARRIGVTEAMLAQDPVQQGARAGNEVYKVPSHTFGQITIGKETFHGPRIDVVDFPLTESDMLIGEDYMHARRFWLSYATRMLFIQPLRAAATGGAK